jgi:ABC-2 type transport system permease protein
MSIVIVFTILNTLDLPFFNAIKPYLFTTHMLGWKGFFDVSVNANHEQVVGSIEHPGAIARSATALVFHICLFYGAAVYFFKRKDILS